MSGVINQLSSRKVNVPHLIAGVISSNYGAMYGGAQDTLRMLIGIKGILRKITWFLNLTAWIGRYLGTL